MTNDWKKNRVGDYVTEPEPFFHRAGYITTTSEFEFNEDPSIHYFNLLEEGKVYDQLEVNRDKGNKCSYGMNKRRKK